MALHALSATARRFSAAAAEALRGYSWPGNIRELRNIIEPIAILCSTEMADLDQLPPAIPGRSASGPRIGAELTLAALERLHI